MKRHLSLALAGPALAGLLAITAFADQPTGGHVAAPAAEPVAAADAEAIYRDLTPAMLAAYALSGDPAAKAYTSWRRYNTTPYLSATHGGRYVNNYANAVATDYANVATRGGTLPAGAILAKDSFTLTSDGERFPAALFLMEKLPPGSSPATGDWRYAMVLPDGTYFGDTRGTNRSGVAYCHDCHRAQAAFDHLFFLPAEFRRGGPNGH